MSAVVSMKREREKVAFADRLASIERVLKRSGNRQSPRNCSRSCFRRMRSRTCSGSRLGPSAT